MTTTDLYILENLLRRIKNPNAEVNEGIAIVKKELAHRLTLSIRRKDDNRPEFELNW